MTIKSVKPYMRVHYLYLIPLITFASCTSTDKELSCKCDEELVERNFNCWDIQLDSGALLSQQYDCSLARLVLQTPEDSLWRLIRSIFYLPFATLLPEAGHQVWC